MAKANMDWKLLREQKLSLLEVISDLEHNDKTKYAEHLTGILHLIDFIQDEAVDSGEASEEEVFNLSSEEERYGNMESKSPRSG